MTDATSTLKPIATRVGVAPPTAAPAMSGLDETAPGGSRRRRLWDLPPDSHDALLGICLPVADLRRLMDKVFSGQSGFDDYRLHTGVVAQCATRNKVSEVLHRELERRFANTVRGFNQARSAGEVAGMWAAAAEVGDFAGALWAGLTHARCDAGLHDRIRHAFHMFQFQAAAFASADVTRVDELVAENKLLARELARVQERHTQWQAERHAERSTVQQDMLRLRGELAARDDLITKLRAGLEQPGAFAVERESRLQLKARAAELAARLTRSQHALDLLAAENLRLRGQRGTGVGRFAQADAPVGPPSQVNDEASTDEAAAVGGTPASALAVGSLQSRSVLCVGGRAGTIPIYRDLVERHGGRFVHHDGGIEDNPHRLDGYLAAADLVICQTGCLSHNAYWRVKDYCKRTGKQCVYLDKAGVSGFLRGLAGGAMKPSAPSP